MDNEYLTLPDPSNPNNQEYLTLPSATDSPFYPPEVASERAQKAHFAMGFESPGEGLLRDRFQSGQEFAIRSEFAANKNLQAKEQALENFKLIAQSMQGAPVSSEETAIAIQASEDSFDPETAIEREYARRFVSDSAAKDGALSPIVQDILKEYPDEYVARAKVATSAIARREAFLSILQKHVAEMQGAGMSTHVAGVVKSFIPGYTWSKTFNLIEGAPTSSILPGSNRAEQIQYLWLLPDIKQAQELLAKALDELSKKDPTLAVDFGKEVISLGTNARVLANLFGIADATTATAIVPIAREIALGASRSLAGAFSRSAGSRVPSQINELPPASVRDLEGIQRHAENPPGGVTGLPGVFPSWKKPGGLLSPERMEVLDQIPWWARREPSPVVEALSTEDYIPVKFLSKKTREEDPVAKFTSKGFEVANPYRRPTEAPEGTGLDLGDLSVPLPNFLSKDKILEKAKTKEALPVSDFLTVSGDQYKVQKGTVIKNGSDVAVRTVYVTPATAERLNVPKGPDVPKARVRIEGDTITLELRNEKSKKWRDATESGLFSETPKVGLVPVSLPVRVGKLKSAEWFAGIDVGTRIRNVYAPIEEQVAEVAAKTPRLTPEVKQTVEDVKGNLKDVVEAQVPASEGDMVGTLAKVGETEKAAIIGAAKEISLSQSENPSEFDVGLRLRTFLPSTHARQFWESNPGRLSREMATRLADNAKARADLMESTLTASEHRVQRLTEEQLAVGINLTKKELLAEYASNPNFSDTIIDVVPSYDPRTNVYTVHIQLGDARGGTFASREQAASAAEFYDLIPGSYTIERQGNSFFIDVPRPIRETRDAIKEVATTNNTSPRSLANTFLGFLRSAQDQLSPVQRGARQVATHVPQQMKAVIIKVAQDNPIITPREKKRLDVMLRDARDMRNPVTKERGYFWETAGEFEQAYYARHGMLPSDREIIAYQNYKMLNDFDYVLRNLEWYKEKSRLGTENWTMRIKTPDGDMVDSDFFNAIKEDKINFATKTDEAILVYDHRTGTTEHIWKNDIRGNEPERRAKRKDLQDKLDSGEFKLLRIFAPNDRPLMGSGLHLDGKPVDEFIHYVITNSAKSKPLDWLQEPYRPGGHVIYKHPWFIKQLNIQTVRGGRNIDLSDLTIMGGVSSERQAKKYAERLDQARILYNDAKAGGDQYKWDAFENFVRKNLPMDVKDLQTKFASGQIRTDMPIRHTYTGRDIFDLHDDLRQLYNASEESLLSSNPARTLDRKFIAERNEPLPTIKEGSDGNPIYGTTHFGDVLDPYPAINNALANAIRSRWMNDYKTLAIDSWIEEFGGLLRPSIADLRRNPIWFFYHATGEIRGGVDNPATLDKLKAALNTRDAILRFMGVRNEVGNAVNHLEQKLFNSIYTHLGQKSADWVSSHLLGAIKDPAVYMRAMAFHTKLGLFSPVQLLLQMQTMNHMIGVAGPKVAYSALPAAWALRGLLATENPAIVKAVAGKMKAFGWKEEDFLDMYRQLKHSGTKVVAGETAVRNDTMEPVVYISNWKRMMRKFLDKGTFFFAEGERMTRLAGYAAAYYEWRLANPTKVFGQYDAASVMNRFSTLTVDMTRASNAAWQEGLASVPTQFLPYTIRLMEQFLGKRLTGMEKLRALATYATIYGIPVAGSAALGIWPWYDDIKKEAMERGININNKWYEAATEGLVSFTLSHALSAATGKPEKEVQYDFARRMGPSGTDLLRDIIHNDKSFLEIATGPSGSVLADIYRSSYPFIHWLAAAFSDDDKRFPLVAEDFLKPVRTITAANSFVNLWQGLNQGRYLSKHGTYISEVTPLDAILHGLTGLSNRQITDTFLKAESLKETKKLKDNAAKEIRENIGNAIKYSFEGDTEKATDFLRRAKVIQVQTGFTPEESLRVFRESLQGFEPLVDRINRQFILKGDYNGRINRTQGN